MYVKLGLSTDLRQLVLTRPGLAVAAGTGKRRGHTRREGKCLTERRCAAREEGLVVC